MSSRRKRPAVQSTTGNGGSVLEELHRDRLQDPPQPAPEPAQPPASAPAGQDSGRVTRMTLDLQDVDRRRLDELAARIGLEIGRPRLGSAAVLRAAVEALTDPEHHRPEVAEAIRAVVADREQRGRNTGP